MKWIQLLIACLWGLALGSCSRDAGVHTPLERNEFTRLTAYSELVSFCRELDRTSDLVTMDTLGYSVEGRMIPYLKISRGDFGADRLNKLIVLVFAQQHGNEPSGKEALLSLARDITRGGHGDLLDHLDVLLVPQVNPDGAERHVRFNADSVDLNRSHLILDAPEIIALRELFYRWEPYVTLDVHEYQPWRPEWIEHGYVQLFDVQYGLATNLNTNETIRLFSEHEFLPYAEREITGAGFTFHNYLVGTPERIRYSTTNINDGRQGFGILNTFSLILEGKNGRTPIDDIRRRTAAQQHAIETLLRFCAEKKADLSSIVRSARRELIMPEHRDFVLTMTRERNGSPLAIPVLEAVRQNDDYQPGDTLQTVIESWYPLVRPGLRTLLPAAYIIPAAEERLIELLERHRILMRPLEEGEMHRGSYYILRRFETAEFEEIPVLIPEMRIEPAIHIAREGDMFVPVDQLHRLLIATALEPQSMHGLLQYRQFRHLQQTGRYPILRIETVDELALSPMARGD
jgi:hypothetical protein